METVLVAVLGLVGVVVTTIGTIAIAKINASVKAGRAETQAVHEEIKTNDGRRAGDYIEATAKRMVGLEIQASSNEGVARELAKRVAEQSLVIDDLDRTIKRLGSLLGGHLIDATAHGHYGIAPEDTPE